MRGYFDGDGTTGVYCLQRKTPQLTLGLISANLNFIKVYKKIIDKKIFNMNTHNNSSIIIEDDGIHNDRYRICWAGNNLAPAVASFLYKDAKIFLDRKHQIITNHIKKYKNGNLDRS
jgi:hypothetical protein